LIKITNPDVKDSQAVKRTGAVERYFKKSPIYISFAVDNLFLIFL